MSRTLVRFQHKTAPSIYEAVGQQLHHYRAQHIGEPLYLDGSGVTFLEADGVLALLNCARLWHRWTGMPCILTSLRLPIHQYLQPVRITSWSECNQAISQLEDGTQRNWSGTPPHWRCLLRRQMHVKQAHNTPTRGELISGSIPSSSPRLRAHAVQNTRSAMSVMSVK